MFEVTVPYLCNREPLLLCCDCNNIEGFEILIAPVSSTAHDIQKFCTIDIRKLADSFATGLCLYWCQTENQSLEYYPDQSIDLMYWSVSCSSI